MKMIQCTTSKRGRIIKEDQDVCKRAPAVGVLRKRGFIIIRKDIITQTII